jgi:hypothetical protein
VCSYCNVHTCTGQITCSEPKLNNQPHAHWNTKKQQKTKQKKHVHTRNIQSTRNSPQTKAMEIMCFKNIFLYYFFFLCCTSTNCKTFSVITLVHANFFYREALTLTAHHSYTHMTHTQTDFIHSRFLLTWLEQLKKRKKNYIKCP